MKRLAFAAIALALCTGAVAAQAPNPIPQPRSAGGIPVSPQGGFPRTPPALPATRPVAAASPAVRLIFFGDSVSALPGYADLVCAALSCVRENPSSAAINGSALMDIPAVCPTIPCGVTSYNTRVGPYTFDALVVEYGRNDLNYLNNYPSSFDLSSWTAAWDALYAQIARPQDAVIVGVPVVDPAVGPCTIPWAASWEDARRQMDAISQREATLHGARFASLEGMTTAMLGPDHVHPNADGSTFIEGRVLRTLIPNPKGRQP